MKKVNYSKVEKFSNWLKKHVKSNGELFKSDKNYCTYLVWAITDMGVNANQFFAIEHPGVLKSVLKSLLTSGSFLNREEKIQSDIISGYNKYIEFIASNK